MNKLSGEVESITQEIAKKDSQIGKNGNHEVALDLEQAKKELIDPKTISKKHDVEGRSVIATEVGQARTESKSIRDSILEKEESLHRAEGRVKDSYLQRGEKVLDLEQRLEKLIVRLKTSISIKDRSATRIQEEIDTVEAEIDNLLTQSKNVRKELKSLKQTQTEIPAPETLLKAYYEKMATSPLTQEEKRKYLTPEFLASLTTEEYIALWRRLNPHFLPHVTRQGFRDHNAMGYHSRGMREFHQGFIAILRDRGLLRPPIVLQGLRARDKASVKKFLEDCGVLQTESEEQAKERLQSLLHFSWSRAPNYPDVTAVHFAAQIVADNFYGGEKGNEIFFIYPSDVLASQYNFAFNGRKKDFTKPQSETSWNDVFVWPDSLENPGIPIDAGIVFLPKSTPVDPNTGSKYASEVRDIDAEEKRVMVKDTELVDSFLEWGETLTDESRVKKVFKEYQQERNYYAQQNKQRSCLDGFRQELQKIGFSEDAATELAKELFAELHLQEDLSDEVLQKILRKSGAIWKRPEDTIPAQEYWERFFAKHPQLRPKHIVYYDGDPTTAVYDFLKQENIGRADTSDKEGPLLGFDDHHVTDMREDPRANAGYDELVETANRLISDHYKSREVDN